MDVRMPSTDPSILSVMSDNPVLEKATIHKPAGVYRSPIVRSLRLKYVSVQTKSSLPDTDKTSQPLPVPRKHSSRKLKIPLLTITTDVSPPHRPPPPLPPYSPEAYNYYSAYNQTKKIQYPQPFNLERVQTSSTLAKDTVSSTSSRSSGRTHISSQLYDSNDDDAKEIISLYGIGRKSTVIDCPQCKRRALTRTTTRDSSVSQLFRKHSWLQCFPCIASKPEAVEHRCSACAAHVANWHEDRDVEIVANSTDTKCLHEGSQYY